MSPSALIEASDELRRVQKHFHDVFLATYPVGSLISWRSSPGKPVRTDRVVGHESLGGLAFAVVEGELWVAPGQALTAMREGRS